MSPYNSLEPCLAGLDSVVLHFNNELSNTADMSTIGTSLDGIPYVMIPKPAKFDVSSRRAGRPPLADKTHDSVANSPAVGTGGEATFFIHRDAVSSPPVPPNAPFGSSSFRPLPPLPRASTLQLPSFLDFSLHITASPGPEIQVFSPQTPPSPTPPPTVVEPTPAIEVADATQDAHATQEIKFSADRSTLDIPAFIHPNSPYVPWALPVRREILRPFTPTSRISGFSVSSSSRPYSRSGAQAPEPMNFSETAYHTGGTLLKVSASLRHFRLAAKRTVKLAVKRIGARLNSSKVPKSTAKRRQEPHVDETGTPHPYSRRSPPSSLLSFDSSDTTTLATWLAKCRRAAVERENDTSNSMTIDEYDRIGSWRNLSNAGGPGASRRLTQSSDFAGKQGTSPPRSPNASRLPDKPDIPSSLSPMLGQSHSDSQVRGYSEFPGSMSRIPTFGSGQDPASVRVLAGREREMSMPGGWALNQ